MNLELIKIKALLDNFKNTNLSNLNIDSVLKLIDGIESIIKYEEENLKEIYEIINNPISEQIYQLDLLTDDMFDRFYIDEIEKKDQYNNIYYIDGLKEKETNDIVFDYEYNQLLFIPKDLTEEQILLIAQLML